MDGTVRDVVVIGGGISGLTAARQLRRAGIDVCLAEEATVVGGCTRTQRREGFLLEKGPFNVIVRDPAFEQMLEDLSDKVTVVPASKASSARYIYRHGRLLAVPTNPFALLTTPLLSFAGRCRLIAGLFLSARPRHPEETIEQAATRRLGRQASDAMVSAAISGIFAGDIRRLSLKACFPPVGDVDAKARSLVGYGLCSAFRSKKGKAKKHRRRWRGMVSIDGGLGALTTALGEELGDDLIPDCRAERIKRTDRGYEIECRRGDGALDTLRCRRLVLATSAVEAGRLVEPLIPGATKTMESIESASLVVLSLGFRRADVGHPMQGFGFLVPHDETDFPLMGVLWADSVFPHHAPPDHRLIRVFIGGSRDPGAALRSDAELLTTATEALRPLLQLSGDPVLVDVCRYEAAIPQYHLGHVEKVKRLRSAVSTVPGLHLIGNYLDGVSLNDCVRFATEFARELSGENVDQADQASRGAESASVGHVGS